jgi:TolA-binding protein
VVTPVRPAGATAAPSAARVAAVRAIEKPASADPGDDEYSYGYRLWEAKFFPEATQQLKLFVEKYPRHARISFGRNLVGRSLLDDGKPREAASWFLPNFQADKAGARAPDSLLYLAVAMKQLADTSRACIALAEFAETYPAESAGRLKSTFDATRAGVKCAK